MVLFERVLMQGKHNKTGAMLFMINARESLHHITIILIPINFHGVRHIHGKCWCCRSELQSCCCKNVIKHSARNVVGKHQIYS